jgi:RNA polymerase sigma-70 factor (ECF subfamily)
MPIDTVYPIGTSNIASSLPEKIKTLLEKAKTGEDAAFSQLYELYFEKIYRFAFYRVGHKEVAEDLTEDVFIKAFNSLHSLSKDSSFESWLYQIARNKVIDYYRSKRLIMPIDEIENLIEYETNLVDIVNLKIEQKLLLKLIKELAPEQQVVIKLKFFEDLPNNQIAELLHKTEGAIRVVQHRAITKLRELIEQIRKDNNDR